MANVIRGLARLQQDLGIMAAEADPGYGKLAAFVDYLRGGPTAAGVRMTPERAMRISAVYGCVRLLSDAVATLPLELYVRGEDGKKRAVDHPLYQLVKFRPNARHTASEFRGLMQADVETRGNAYAVKVRIDGRLTELVPVAASRVTVEEDRAGTLRYGISSAIGGDTTWLSADRVLHIRGPFGGGVCGAAPAEEFRELFGLAFAIEAYLAYCFANGVRPSIALSTDKSLGDKAFSNLKSWIDNEYVGFMRAGKPLLLEEGLKPVSISQTNEQAQVVELHEKVTAGVARVYLVPLHMLASHIAQPRSNMEQQAAEFASQALRPRLVRWEERYQVDVLDSNPDLFTEFNLEELLRGDVLARSQVYRSAIESGWMTRNEVRARENLNPLDGLDEPLTPLNMQRGEAPPAR